MLVFHSKEISSSNVTIKYGDLKDPKDYISFEEEKKKSFIASFYKYLLRTYNESSSI